MWLFVNPIEQKFHWGRAAIQVAFTIFIVTQTWLVPFGETSSIGSARGSWYAPAPCSSASPGRSIPSQSMLYVGAVFGGIGAGAIAGAAYGNALKWFPDRRGLAAD